jgi:eukaryotic-like serine/threonine-protein kinase
VIGQTISHYRVLRKLGGGGMGVVYEAEDLRLHRHVALKFLPEDLARDATALERFRREANAASALNHPNICTIYDIGEDRGQPFIVMEMLEGESLKQRIREGPIPTDELLDFGIQTSDALEAAHAKGIIHRDVKPGNIFIVGGGRVKILDFGLAKVIPSHLPESESDEESLTVEGVIPGTTAYMSPEQVRGEEIGARSDLFSLGVVLYEMATGKRPFVGKNRVLLMDAILNAQPVAPSRVNQALPTALDAIIAKSLEKDREPRYQTAAEMAADLKRLRRDTESGVQRALPVAARKPRGWVIAMVALLVVAGLGFAVMQRRARTSGDAASIQSIAVLPLENLSRDPQQEYFSDGMTEELTAELAQLSSLRVISRTSVMQYKGVHKPLPVIARELNVDAVVEGSVLRDHDRVRITAQLIRAASDQHLWAETYDRKLRDVLDLQGEVARDIAKQIKITLTPEEKTRLASRREVDPEAHDLYLQGLYHLNKGTEAELKAAIDDFQQALVKVPGYAPAYSGLADCYLALSTYYEPPREAMPKAKAAAQRALALDESLSAAHTSLGNVNLFFDWDWPATEREAQRAIELDPSNANAHDLYAVYFSTTGRHDQAMAELRRAHRLDPYSLMIAADLVSWPTMGRQYDLAIENGRRAIALEPNNAPVHSWLALPYALRGQFPEAVKEAETGHRLDDSPIFTSILAYSYAKAGRRQEAEKVLAELRQVLKKRYSCTYEVGVAYVAMGQNDEAFRWFQKALADRSDCMPLVKVDPRLDSIRSDPRYQELVRRVGVPQ